MRKGGLTQKTVDNNDGKQETLAIARTTHDTRHTTHVSLHELMESVEKIQYQASLAITGCWKGSSRDRLYEELGWESLSDRRNIK